MLTIKQNENKLKQRILNSAFYATIGQAIINIIIFGLPKGSYIGIPYYSLLLIDFLFYILLGFFVSKGKLWAGIILIIWFCLDNLLPGLINIFINFSVSILFRVVFWNYFFGQFYYKAFICLKRDYNQNRK